MYKVIRYLTWIFQTLKVPRNISWSHIIPKLTTAKRNSSQKLISKPGSTGCKQTSVTYSLVGQEPEITSSTTEISSWLCILVLYKNNSWWCYRMPYAAFFLLLVNKTNNKAPRSSKNLNFPWLIWKEISPKQKERRHQEAQLHVFSYTVCIKM